MGPHATTVILPLRIITQIIYIKVIYIDILTIDKKNQLS
jgi:hypothetical protein